jgi:trk system potassium uptake protein TrkH
MYSGRIGSLSFALAFAQSQRKAHVEQVAETINVG